NALVCTLLAHAPRIRARPASWRRTIVLKRARVTENRGLRARENLARNLRLEALNRCLSVSFQGVFHGPFHSFPIVSPVGPAGQRKCTRASHRRPGGRRLSIAIRLHLQRECFAGQPISLSRSDAKQ